MNLQCKKNNTINLIENTVGFLQNHIQMSEGHMVDFFTRKLYKTINKELQAEIEDTGYEATVTSIISSNFPANTPALNNYISLAKSFSLYNLKEVCFNLKDIKGKFKSNDHHDKHNFKLNSFMNVKKAHEVETMSSLVAMMAETSKTSHLVDIGDGKGYLSSLVSFHYKIPVLGVDASFINTSSAVDRAKKLEKHWNHITNTTSKEDFPGRSFLYKQVTQIVTEDTNFDELISRVFLEKHSGIGLIGLHTCGNLGPSSIRIFNGNQNIKSICNVSCCYHLLNEKYLASRTRLLPLEKHDGFPMSDYLISQNYQLGRSTRMLSAHSIDRIIKNQILPSKIIYYRAILEIIFEKYCKKSPEKNVGKYRHDPLNFIEYARDAMKKVDVNIPISDEELDGFYEEYKNERIRLNIYHLLRSMLAPAIESLILLDRYLFLLEQGHENVFLVQLFDPVVSPRCYGLLAFKS